MQKFRPGVTLMLVLVAGAACEQASETTDDGQIVPQSSGNDEATTGSAENSPVFGKPTAPVTIDYKIVGKPVVGVPVAIDVMITSPSGPVDVRFSIADSSAVMFQNGQVERVQMAAPRNGTRQQLTVIPQREGRVYVNVSAEVATDIGAMIRTLAIPVTAGRATKEMPVNGVLTDAPDGGTVISMPAEVAQ